MVGTVLFGRIHFLSHRIYLHWLLVSWNALRKPSPLAVALKSFCKSGWSHMI